MEAINTTRPCTEHPAARLYSWFAYDGVLCVCCCECGACLLGHANPPWNGAVREPQQEEGQP